MLKKVLDTIFWGNSVALAWTWGIGLFFTIQLSIQFGFNGLLTFATINAFGLTLFGLVNHYIAKRYVNADEFEGLFFAKAKNFKFAFYLYQFLALTLTLYAVLKYVTLPLGILSILTCIMFFGASIFFGEEFGIQRIKYSHLFMGLGVVTALLTLLSSDIVAWGLSKDSFSLNPNLFNSSIKFQAESFSFFYWVPIFVGFFFGPWLDLQHWQRAVRINKEGLSIAQSYLWGGAIFWLIIMAHGITAISIYNYAAGSEPIADTDMFFQAKNLVTNILFANHDLRDLLIAYLSFVSLAALATFDSGYVAFKWYTAHLIKDSKNLILSFVPSSFIISAIPFFIACMIAAVTSLHFSEIGNFIARYFDPGLEKFFRIELEYYMAFYASFFIMYDVVFLRSVMFASKVGAFPFLKLFSTGLFSISIFGLGYFTQNTLIMAAGSILPLVYGILTHDKAQAAEQEDDIPAKQINNFKLSSSSNNQKASTILNSSNASCYEALPEGAVEVSVPGCYFIDKWFTHPFMPTYQDTNSVGNIYFAMYGMWVGKVRELFFMHAMPNFDPKTSDFLILTKSYNHKFLRETNEFHPVKVQIRIKDYNRKFVTMEHQILNEKQEILGKGEQSLMFVDSHNYALIDIPQEVYSAFVQYA